MSMSLPCLVYLAVLDAIQLISFREVVEYGRGARFCGIDVDRGD